MGESKIYAVWIKFTAQAGLQGAGVTLIHGNVKSKWAGLSVEAYKMGYTQQVQKYPGPTYRNPETGEVLHAIRWEQDPAQAAHCADTISMALTQMGRLVVEYTL